MVDVVFYTHEWKMWLGGGSRDHKEIQIVEGRTSHKIHVVDR